jgi:hypothetical protein
MTKLDVYCSALDRQVIANREWENGKMRYIKIGGRIYTDDDFPTEIRMLDEKDTDQWVLGGQVTRWFKFKFRIKLLKRLWTLQHNYGIIKT